MHSFPTSLGAQFAVAGWLLRVYIYTHRVSASGRLDRNKISIPHSETFSNLEIVLLLLIYRDVHVDTVSALRPWPSAPG